jgi:hypothetical protein
MLETASPVLCDTVGRCLSKDGGRRVPVSKTFASGFTDPLR